MRAVLLLAVLFVPQARAQTVPVLHQHVTDLTQTLDIGQTAELEAQLVALERRKGSQITLLIVPTTQGQAIEEYALAVAEKNQIGRKKIDDGLLLLIAKDDRKARIEVGYGLEGVVPDAIASRVIREYLTPHFRQGDFFGGIKESLDVLIKLIDGEPLPPPMADDKTDISYPFVIVMAFLIGCFISIFATASKIKPIALRRLGAGSIAAALAWLFLSSGVAIAIAALIAFMFADVAPGRSSSGGGWGSSSGGSDFGGGSSSGSSGWSGGGGSFGGGGASGGW